MLQVCFQVMAGGESQRSGGQDQGGQPKLEGLVSQGAVAGGGGGGVVWARDSLLARARAGQGAADAIAPPCWCEGWPRARARGCACHGKSLGQWQGSREKGAPPGCFYYVEEKVRREEKLAAEQNELATWLNNPIQSSLQLPPAVPWRDIQAWSWEHNSPPQASSTLADPKKWSPLSRTQQWLLSTPGPRGWAGGEHRIFPSSLRRRFAEKDDCIICPESRPWGWGNKQHRKGGAKPLA
jgi:hypothetical protein